MANTYLVEPDLGFIKEVTGLGGDSLKKCFQCGVFREIPDSPDQKR